MFNKVMIAVSCLALPLVTGCLSLPSTAPLSGRNVHTGSVYVGNSIDSEKVLASDGVWDVIEKNRAIDPAAAHKRAREQVNTGRRNVNPTLSAHFKPDAKSGQDGNMRVLMLKPRKGDESHAYATLETIEQTVITPRTVVKAAGITMPEPAMITASIAPDDAPDDAVNAPIPRKRPAISPSTAAIVTQEAQPPRVLQQILSQNTATAAASRYTARALYRVGDDGVVIAGHKPRVPHDAKIAAPAVKHAVFTSGRASSRTASLVKARSGYHEGNVRLVIETSSATQYKAVIDPLRNVLSIRIKNAAVIMKKTGSLKGTKAVLGSYSTTQRDNGDVMLEIRLKEQVKIVNAMFLPPNTTSQHRIVLDLQPL